MASTIVLTPSTDKTGATDTAAINTALVSVGSYGDATKLVGCSTERNSQDGVLITNSSAAGTAWRSPGRRA